MPKVKSNHDGLLNVAGVDLRPGATVEVSDNAFKAWSKGHAAKVWMDQKLVEVDGKVSKTSAKTTEPDTGAGELTMRQKLEGRATALGVNFSDETGDADLLEAVEAAEKAAGANEREALLNEARALGLNPNVNTGTEKLKKLIADKKAQQ